MAGVAKPKTRKCQQKCYPLETVQEDCVSKLDEVPRKRSSKQYCGEGKERFKAKGGFLSKLRNSYIKLMNDMASSADYSGVSAVYGCSTGHLDFPSAAAMAAMRSSKQDEEIEQVAFLAGAAPQTQGKH